MAQTFEYDFGFVPVTEEMLREQLDEQGLLTNLVQHAIDIANASHGDQTRDNGEPFLPEHVLHVAATAGRHFQMIGAPLAQQELVVVGGLLHDTVEDTAGKNNEFTLPMCEDLFGAEVTNIVDLLTKAPKTKPEQRAAYISRLMRDDTPEEVVALKIIDRVNNLWGSFRGLPDSALKTASYIEETHRLYFPLAQRLGPEHARLVGQLGAITAMTEHQLNWASELVAA